MENTHALIAGNAGCRGKAFDRTAAIFFAILLATVSAFSADSSTNKSATVRVSGSGLIGNREMSRLLRNFQVNGKMPVTIDRSFVEDAALVLLARANDDGYLLARLHASFSMVDGSQQQFCWTNALDVDLPSSFAAQGARFKLEKGVRFYYQKITFEGLDAIPKRQAENYFVSTDMLLRLRGSRAFSPSGLKTGLATLGEAYLREGYQDAVVTTNEVVRNDTTGAVRVKILVREGLPAIVRSVTVKVHETNGASPILLETLTPQEPYSRWWQQDLARELQADQHAKGHPDATVAFSVRKRETNAAMIHLDLLAEVKPGPLVRLGEVIFRGNKRTRTSVLESRIKLEEAELLDRVEAEKSRQRLARLGVFNSVNLEYEEVKEDERNVIYDLQETKPISLSLLAGYGSYEMLRGGLEFEHRNVWGLAHDLRLRGVQSFKSSQGNLVYTVPEIFSENMNLFLNGSGLWREEESFDRKEYGGALGVERRLIPIQTDFSLRYDYQFLNALNVASTSPDLTGVQEARAAAFVLDLTRDRRDHPMLPGRGLKLFTRMEFASEALGGNVDYQRLLFGASYHVELRGGRFLHFGLTHAMSFTLGGDPDQLPFNKRFFPGGENTVRGYQEGNASPLDENGDQLGAETYTLLNVEFEQLLTKSWSVVAFADTIGFAQHRENYPWDQGLYSVGGGIRWRSPVGPVRLEYGYNLNRREHDPVGTLHFSIGFPF